MTINSDEAVNALITEIARQAVDDIIAGHPYVDWPEEKIKKIMEMERTGKLKKGAYSRACTAIRNSIDAKNFFRSNWFAKMFPNTDGEMMIQMAEEKYRDLMERRRGNHKYD